MMSTKVNHFIRDSIIYECVYVAKITCLFLPSYILTDYTRFLFFLREVAFSVSGVTSLFGR